MAVKTRNLNFTDVKDKGSFSPKRVKAGDYRMKIVNVEEGKSRKDNLQWVFTLELAENKRATYPYYCALDGDALFKLRNLMLAAGLKAPKKRLAVDPNKLIGKEIGASLEDDEFEGRLKSKVEAVFPVSELNEAEDEDDDEPEDDEETDEDDSDDEEEDDSDADESDEDEDGDEEEEEEDDDLDLGDDDDEEGEEEEEEPAPKKKGKTAPAKAAPKKAAPAKKAAKAAPAKKATRRK